MYPLYYDIIIADARAFLHVFINKGKQKGIIVILYFLARTFQQRFFKLNTVQQRNRY